MYAQVEKVKEKENKRRTVTNSVAQRKSGGASAFKFVVNRPETVGQRKRQEIVNQNSPKNQLMPRGSNYYLTSPKQHVIQRVKLNIEGVDGLPLDTDDLISINEVISKAAQNGDHEMLSRLMNEVAEKDKTKSHYIREQIKQKLLPHDQLKILAMFPITQQDEADWMTQIVDSPIGKNTGPEIPKEIHRFWTGGCLSDDAIKTLMESVEKTKDKGWKSTLWHSAFIEAMLGAEANQEDLEKRSKQRSKLIENGYTIRAIEELADGKSGVTTDDLLNGAQIAADTVKLGGSGCYDDVKYFSDLARLMYLHDVGGHHMDVDIGMGIMDLDQAYTHNDEEGQVPLMGTLARDNGDKEVVESMRKISAQQNSTCPPERPEDYLELVRSMTEKAGYASGMFNALIASRPGTDNLKSAIDNMLGKLRKGELISGMSVNKDLLNTKKLGFAKASKLSIPPYLLRIQHLTPESDK